MAGVENAIVGGSIFHFLEETDPAPPPCFRRRLLSVPADFYVRGPASSDDGLSLARSPWFMLGRHGKPLLLRARSPEAESCLSLTPSLLHFFPPAEAALP